MPTPVSALIHAATMVTAGVYLLMRSSPLIEYSSTVLMLALWIGAFTTIFSSLVGLFQQDIKKVIAYSTMSQLGMMVIAIGLSSYNIALFHLINHAFYKALLFLGAGSVIHAVADNQDFRKYGGLRPFLPLTYSVMLIASLSLVAFPFMTGFYSKDFILESSYGQFSFFSIAVYFIATLAAMFTTLYSVKVLYVTFLANPNGSQASYKMAHEGDIYMSLPLIILAVFSIFFGYVTKDIFIGLGSGFFNDNSLFIHPKNEIMIDTEFAVYTFYKLLPLSLTVLFSILSFALAEYSYKSVLSFKLSKLGYNFFSFFNQRFYIEMFYNTYITDLMLKMGGQTTKVLNKGSIELIGPFGLEKVLVYLSNTIGGLNTGVITNYALYILVGLIMYITMPFVISNLFIIMLLAILSLDLSYQSSYTSNVRSIQSGFIMPFLKKKLNKEFFIRFFVSCLVSLMYTSPMLLLSHFLVASYVSALIVASASFIVSLILTNILDVKSSFWEFFKLSFIVYILYLVKTYGINSGLIQSAVLGWGLIFSSSDVYAFVNVPALSPSSLAIDLKKFLYNFADNSNNQGSSRAKASDNNPDLVFESTDKARATQLRKKGYNEIQVSFLSMWWPQGQISPEQYPGNELAKNPYDPNGDKTLINSLGACIIRWESTLRNSDFTPDQKRYLTEYFAYRGINTTPFQTKGGEISFRRLNMLDLEDKKEMVRF